jgi:T-complex protein 1 subunit eta
MSYMLAPNILVLKEGTENSKGKEQIISNINACNGLVEVIKSTLVKFSNFNFRVPEEWIR